MGQESSHGIWHAARAAMALWTSPPELSHNAISKLVIQRYSIN
jgi:hypothetical protein